MALDRKYLDEKRSSLMAQSSTKKRNGTRQPPHTGSSENKFDKDLNQLADLG